MRPPGAAEGCAASDGRWHATSRWWPVSTQSPREHKDSGRQVFSCTQLQRMCENRGGVRAGTHVSLRVFFQSVSSHLFTTALLSVSKPLHRSVSDCAAALPARSAALISRAHTPPAMPGIPHDPCSRFQQRARACRAPEPAREEGGQPGTAADMRPGGRLAGGRLCCGQGFSSPAAPAAEGTSGSYHTYHRSICRISGSRMVPVMIPPIIPVDLPYCNPTV